MLVQKMQAAAKEQGIEVAIQEKSVTDAANEIDKVDVLLLGPQVGYQKAEMETLETEERTVKKSGEWLNCLQYYFALFI